MSQVIKKRKIVIASVLKPVDDTRMFEKIGQSLADSGWFEVHMIGYPSRAAVKYPNVSFHPLKTFSRISFARLLRPWSVIRKVFKLKPAVFLLTTHELLFAGIITKLFAGIPVVYDVQENYFRNILYTNSFPLLLKPFLALYVRLKEILSVPFITHFLLAEKSYQRELSFLPKSQTVIENKFKKSKSLEKSSKKSEHDGLIHLLFSGTLAETTGVFDAIELARRLHENDPVIRLTVVGYTSRAQTLHKLRKLVQQYSFMELIGGDQLVPHQNILEEIVRSDFGIISYPPNYSTTGSVPTKLYEYLGSHLPIIMSVHQSWTGLATSYNAAILYDEKAFDAFRILEQMKSGEFYTTNPANAYWDSEAERLLTVFKRICD